MSKWGQPKRLKRAVTEWTLFSKQVVNGHVRYTRRKSEYAGSKMLEAERRATASEIYQSTQLPQFANTDSDTQDRV